MNVRPSPNSTPLTRSTSHVSALPTDSPLNPTTSPLARTTSSLADVKKPNYVNRSKSFSGFGLGIQRNIDMGSNAWKQPILGDLLRSPKFGRKGNVTLGSTISARTLTESFKKAGLKLPKVPRPQRTITVFQSLRRGIRECVQATEDDLVSLRLTDHAASPSTAQARTIELEKQIRAAERYRKRLEFHLSKIDELEEQYFIHQQLREGVKNMAKAYVQYPGDRKKDSLSNVKTGYKECTQIMCAIEAQLENLMGTFHCQMKGLLGFARLMPGDVYEMTVRHGHQKWKTRGRISESSQNWDHNSYVFKALLADVFEVKAVEVKLLAKHSLLGQKRCETKDLFSAHPQMMTVSINPHGTIKLSIYVTWNPLEGVEEGVNIFDPLHRAPHSGVRRTNYPAIEGYHFAFINRDGSLSRSSSDLSSPTSSTGDTTSPPYFRRSMPVAMYPSASAHSDLGHYARPHPIPHSQRPVSVAVMDTISESSAWDTGTMDFGIVKPDVFDVSPLREALDTELSKTISDSSLGRTPGLEESLHSLKSVLEDCQGQYPDLQKLEEQLQALYRLIKGSVSSLVGLGSRSRSSSGDITIETALEAFDFLDSDEFYADGYGSGKNSRRHSLDQLENNCTLSPESTTKTADSGIESIANRLSEDRALESSFGSSPEPLTTGNEQVDQALLWHLSYCERLLENLGNFGPLKCREIFSLDRLKMQADIIEQLLDIAREGSQVPDLQQVMSEATSSKELRQFWVRCVDGPVLYCSIERFQSQLEKTYGDLVREQYEIDYSRVFDTFLARLLDLPHFDSRVSTVHPNITMHQLMTFISDEQQREIREYFQHLAGEVWLCDRLRSGNTDIVIKTMLTFKKDVAPPAECLRIMALLLITDNTEVRRSTASYIRSLNTHAEVRSKVLVVYLEALEHRNPDIRCSATIALRLLQASEALKQLVYISQTDPSSFVQHTAKDTLLSFGIEGRKAYEDSQLSSHGFQGIKVQL